ncbi:endothelin-converting enzyme homolog [Paramacrobiotus metropolitanus]|uniref:endothelin-converting enzyme homolog n=1 Tax=Paramacrobiotus metropolitanus TaxID=2943436 RepID=UPI002445D971|nr:endothelin-converting enzyme homolog [Paramacrobiotus metropolitanus]
MTSTQRLIQAKLSFYDTLRTIDQSNSWINLQKLSRHNARNDPYLIPDMTTVFAKTFSECNYIAISAACLQEPMFYASNMDIVNYARMGFIMGHEFTHVLDIGGKEFGVDGKPFNWWTNATQNNYNARNFTLVDFYNDISAKDDSVVWTANSPRERCRQRRIPRCLLGSYFYCI